MTSTASSHDPVGSYNFLAEPFHCDFLNRLTVGHLGNYMLNAADYHAAERGFGMVELQSKGRAWVLSRLAIEMTAMPKAYERFTIQTWVENAMRYFTKRNFAAFDAEGLPIGYGRSVWAMIDTATRQPVNLLEENDGALSQYVCADKPCPIESSRRVNVGREATLASQLRTGYSDVDVNGHVNSIRYIEHVINIFPLSYLRQHALRRFEVAYVSEAYGGQCLNLYREELSPCQYAVRVGKVDPASGEETEAVRCLLTFA